MQTLLRGGTIVTCDTADTVIEGDVLMEGKVLVEVGSGPAISRAKSGGSAVRVVEAKGCAIVPGFVQGHVHLCQTILRGMAEDMNLLAWLEKRIWPLEAAHDERSMSVSAELGLVEMMRAGTTSVLDMGTVHHHDAVMDACVRSGIRAISGKAMMDRGEGVPKGLRESTRASLAESEQLMRRWCGKGDGRIGYAFAPRFILSCSEELIRSAAAIARESGALVHTHAAEQAAERIAVREAYGAEDVAILEKWGLTGPHAILAHGVQLTPREMQRLAEQQTRVVHCPSANLKLGSGIANLHELDRAGVPLALGADGAPCNNNLDPWTEMRHAALLSKITASTDSITACRVLRLATIDGARALGLDGVTGSLESKKRADVVVVHLGDAGQEPGGDVFSKLVYATTRAEVRHVWVDGAWIVRDGVHQRLDEERVVHRAREVGRQLFARAEIG